MDLLEGSGVEVRSFVESHIGACVVDDSTLTATDGRVRVYCDYAKVSEERANDVTYWVGVPKALVAHSIVINLDDETYIVIAASEFSSIAREFSCTGNDREWHPNIRSTHDRDQFWWTLRGITAVKQLTGYLDRPDLLRGSSAGGPMANGFCPWCELPATPKPARDVSIWESQFRTALPPRLRPAAFVGWVGPPRGQPTGTCSKCGALAFNGNWSKP